MKIIEHQRLENSHFKLKFEFLSQSKIRKNKSPALAFHSYELQANYSHSFCICLQSGSVHLFFPHLKSLVFSSRWYY